MLTDIKKYKKESSRENLTKIGILFPTFATMFVFEKYCAHIFASCAKFFAWKGMLCENRKFYFDSTLAISE